MRRFISVLLLSAGLLPGAGQAQVFLPPEPIGSYTAFIGQADLYNSSGTRLTQPWAVLAQDRANFHRYGLSQPGDDWDFHFQDINMRGAMGAFWSRGQVNPGVAQAIVNGNVAVRVTLWGTNAGPQYITVGFAN